MSNDSAIQARELIHLMIHGKQISPALRFFRKLTADDPAICWEGVVKALMHNGEQKEEQAKKPWYEIQLADVREDRVGLSQMCDYLIPLIARFHTHQQIKTNDQVEDFLVSVRESCNGFYDMTPPMQAFMRRIIGEYNEFAKRENTKVQNFE